MTETPHDRPADEPQPDSDTDTDTKTAGPRVTAEQARDLGRLRRSVTDRKVAGVAGGLGRHLDVDPTILRVAFVVLCFFGGAGFVVYGAAWLLVPEEGKSDAAISASAGTRSTVLIIAGVLGVLLLVSDGWWGGWGFPWPLAVIGLIAFLILRNKDKNMNTPTQGQPGPNPQWEHGGTTTMTDPQAPWMPPSQPTYQQPAPKPDRGPKLFWFTLALVAVALGALGLYDAAGFTVTDAAYPALALTVIGVMLVVGAWIGRAGGLIAIGVVAAIALAGTSAAQNVDEPRIEDTPTRASQLENSYYVPGGSIDLDLTEIRDLESLDGREIDAETTAGEIVVTVPDDLTVHVSADIDAGGSIDVLGEERGGFDVTMERTIDAGTGAPELDLNLDLDFGTILVRQQ